MNGANGQISGFIGRLKAEIRQDKKKTSILAILLIVAGVVGGRLVVTRGPAKTASATNSPSVSKANVSDVGKNTGAAQAFNTRALRPHVDPASMDDTINRDLFQPDIRYFPVSGKGGERRTSSRPEQPSKIDAEEQERQNRTEHLNSIRAQAEELSLTSTMLGKTPTALINGQVLREGDSIRGFVLKAIASDYCVVVMDGVDVKLRLSVNRQE